MRLHCNENEIIRLSLFRISTPACINIIIFNNIIQMIIIQSRLSQHELDSEVRLYPFNSLFLFLTVWWIEDIVLEDFILDEFFFREIKIVIIICLSFVKLDIL